MKTMRKITALFLVLALLLALSATVFAAEIGDGGITNLTAEDKTITLKKQITAYNPTGLDINAPTITYNYSIAAGSANKTIKDPNGIGTATVAGPTGATITSSVSWSPAEQLQTAQGGKENYKTITVSFSAVTFPSAGVFRYEITETATYTNTGVTNGGSHTRYLDVYVKNAATAGQFEIYGYVLFTNNNNIDGTSGASDEDKVAAAVKTEGFVGDSADKYYTYNLTIGKDLEGDPGMINNQFPFGISFTGSETGVLPIISKTGTATIPTWSTAGDISSFNTTADSGSLKLASAARVKITGIPIGTSVEIFEKNNVTGTTYSSASQGADTNAAVKSIAPSVVSNTAVVNAQTAGSAEDKIVTFTNTLSTISPTGYVSRYAPYGLMLIAGVILLVIVLKRRKHSDEE